MGDHNCPCQQSIRDLKRMVRDFECRAALYQQDISWIDRALAAEAKLAGQSSAVVERARVKHPAIIAAEAYALFGGFLEQEFARLSEKRRLIEVGAFDDVAATADAGWLQQNQGLGLRAVERENDACVQARRLQNAAFGDLFAEEPTA